jgi:protein TonB
MAYADQKMSGSRVVAIILVALIHIAVGYALVTGLAYSAMKKAIERVTTVDIEEPEEEPEEEPPPPEPDTPPPPIVAPPPPINIAVAPPQVQVVDRPPPIQQPVIPVARPPAPPPPSQARGVRPRNQSSWASRIQQNYPARALREGTEGTVGVNVTVNGEGRVSACSVTSSSGSSALDEAACQGMQRYARFDPALSADGSPISASWSTRIVYQLQ